MTRNERKTGAINRCYNNATGMANVTSEIEKLERQLDAADDHINLLKGHEKVCDESLDRCEKKLFGDK